MKKLKEIKITKKRKQEKKSTKNNLHFSRHTIDHFFKLMKKKMEKFIKEKHKILTGTIFHNRIKDDGITLQVLISCTMNGDYSLTVPYSNQYSFYTKTPFKSEERNANGRSISYLEFTSLTIWCRSDERPP